MRAFAKFMTTCGRRFVKEFNTCRSVKTMMNFLYSQLNSYLQSLLFIFRVDHQMFYRKTSRLLVVPIVSDLYVCVNQLISELLQVVFSKEEEGIQSYRAVVVDIRKSIPKGITTEQLHTNAVSLYVEAASAKPHFDRVILLLAEAYKTRSQGKVKIEL